MVSVESNDDSNRLGPDSVAEIGNSKPPDLAAEPQLEKLPYPSFIPRQSLPYYPSFTPLLIQLVYAPILPQLDCQLKMKKKRQLSSLHSL
ncbi:hypothetical protein PanWU01x14_103760 [Parasponia andersonii]|uniref:Uncharacterized protein n=1 Tax=Parasponia andersonii TaxID=3476 RepID=A0A2P5D2E6_PARAD|nr:hypothetical protein PanWU01x14_103760 [Parasponia andersonii]